MVSSDHWGLNAVQLCGMIHKIAFSEANRCLSLSLSFCAAETVMDTRVATAELGWTAYPNSGVSRSRRIRMLSKKQFQKFVFKLFLLGGRRLDRATRRITHSARTDLQPDRQIGRKTGRMGA